MESSVEYVYVKNAFFFGMVFYGNRVFFSHVRLRGKQGAVWYITMHVRTPAELLGGALSIQCR